MASNWFGLRMKTFNAWTCLTGAAVAGALSAFPEIRQAELLAEDVFIGLDIAKANRYPRLFASYDIGTRYYGDSALTVPHNGGNRIAMVGEDVVGLIAEQEIYNSSRPTPSARISIRGISYGIPPTMRGNLNNKPKFC